MSNQDIKRQTVHSVQRALCRCPSPASASVPGVKSASTPPATQHTHHVHPSDTVPARRHSLLFSDSLFPLCSTENIVLFTFSTCHLAAVLNCIGMSANHFTGNRRPTL